MTKTVVGLFETFETAEQAVRSLVDAGFERQDISLIAQDATHGNQPPMQGPSTGDVGHAGEGAAAGAGTGAVLGGLAGLLVGIGALAIPGIGPIIAAGPLATALAGAGIGAVAGGLIGALVEAGVPEEQARAYADAVQHGGTLVSVRAADEQADQAREIMNRFHPVDMQNRSREWREANQPDRTSERQAFDTSGLSADRTAYSRDPGQHTADRQDWSVHDRDVAGPGTPALTEAQMAQRTSGGEGYHDREAEDAGPSEGSMAHMGAVDDTAGSNSIRSGEASLGSGSGLAGAAGPGGPDAGQDGIATTGETSHSGPGTTGLGDRAFDASGGGVAGIGMAGSATTGAGTSFGADEGSPDEFAWEHKLSAPDQAGAKDLEPGPHADAQFGHDFAQHHHVEDAPQDRPGQDMGRQAHDTQTVQPAEPHAAGMRSDDMQDMGRAAQDSPGGMQDMPHMTEGQDRSMQSMEGQEAGQPTSGGDTGQMQHGRQTHGDELHGQEMSRGQDAEGRDLTGAGHGQWEERDVSAIVSSDTERSGASFRSEEAGMLHAAGGDEGWEGQGHDLTGSSTGMDRPARQWQEQGLGANMSGSQQNATARDFASFAPDFRSHYDMFLGGGQLDYGFYEPGYRYGYDLAGDQRNQGKKWSEIEPDAQSDWQRQHPEVSWTDVRDAVRYAWERSSSAGEQAAGSDQNMGWISDRPGSGTDLQQGQNFLPPEDR